MIKAKAELKQNQAERKAVSISFAVSHQHVKILGMPEDEAGTETPSA